MAFNSYAFVLVFLPAAFAGHYLAVKSFGRDAVIWWLILVSGVFYAYPNIRNLLLIILSIGLGYGFVWLLLTSNPNQRRLRALVFTAAIALDVALLSYFKYKNFFIETVNTVFTTHVELTALLLPLGISFLTFQKIALLADVHGGIVKEVRFADYVLFTLFFPRV